MYLCSVPTEPDFGEPPSPGGSEAETGEGIAGHRPHGVPGQNRLPPRQGEGEEATPDEQQGQPRCKYSLKLKCRKLSSLYRFLLYFKLKAQ